MIETCQPYGCGLVVAFGFLLGLVVLPIVFFAFGLRERLTRWSLDRKQRALDATFPHWRETVNSRRFAAWYSVQPTDVRCLGESWRVKDAQRVLELYAKRPT